MFPFCFCFSKRSSFFSSFNFNPIISDLNNNTLSSFSSLDLNNNPQIFSPDDKPETSINPDQLALLNKHTNLREINYSLILEDDGTSPQSPLHSVKTFEELKLDKQLLNGIYNMGFRRPSRIQERALPQLLAYPPRNMIAQSQNGTGKTVEQILSANPKNPNSISRLLFH